MECLLEGLEAMALLAAIESGGKSSRKAWIFYCSSKYHFIRSCPVRNEDMAKGIFRGRSNRGGPARGFVRNGRYFRGRGRSGARGYRGYGNNSGGRGRWHSAGAMVGAEVMIAEEGHPEVEVSRGGQDESGIGAMGLDALQLSDDQLKRIVNIRDDERIGAIFGVDNQ